MNAMKNEKARKLALLISKVEMDMDYFAHRFEDYFPEDLGALCTEPRFEVSNSIKSLLTHLPSLKSELEGEMNQFRGKA